MEFNLPTTKEEMYRILNDLFYHYRIMREEYKEIALEELQLQRLEYTPETDEELMEKAEKIVAADKAREKAEYIEKLNAEITEITTKITLTQENTQNEIQAVKDSCQQSIDALYKDGAREGAYYTSLIDYNSTKLQDSRNATIYKINSESNATVAELTAKKQVVEQKLSNVDAYFEQIHAFDTERKIIELKEKRLATIMEVFKYNNGLDEKEQRYKNTIEQNKASLRLRFLDIRSGQFTKDQLVEMGYYEDVVRCVCGYFDRLDPYTAFQDIASEKKLAIYLDDFYQNVVYTYSLLA